MNDDAPAWAPAAGVGILIALFATLGLVAAGGWDWFRRFLEGSAADWIGGLGAAAAAVVALHLATKRERRQEKAARELAVAFKVALLDGIRDMQFAAAIGSFEAVGRARADLEQALALGHAVPIADLPAEHLLTVVVLRSLNARCLHTGGVFLQIGDKNGFASLKANFDGYHRAYFKRQGLSDEDLPSEDLLKQTQ